MLAIAPSPVIPAAVAEQARSVFVKPGDGGGAFVPATSHWWTLHKSQVYVGGAIVVGALAAFFLLRR